MRLCVFGSMNRDLTFRVPHIAAPGETLASVSLTEHPGGKGLNQAIALSRAGGDVFFAGCCGPDGEGLLRLLEREGIDTRFIRRSDTPTGQAVIQVADDGENAIVLFPGANHKIREADISVALAFFSPGDLLVLQNEISGLPFLLEEAAARGLRTALNPSPCTEDLRALDLSLLSVLLVNEGEACFLTGCGDAASAVRALRDSCPALTGAVTLGSRGAVGFSAAEEIVQPAFCVPAVDTTGAGDTFTGYFLVSLAQGLPLKDCLRRASAAAALAVGRPGAASSIPAAAETDSFLRRSSL